MGDIELPDDISTPEFELNTQILEKEADLERLLLMRRLAIFWLAIGAPVSICLLVTGNIFLDLSASGARSGFNTLGGLVVILCLPAPAIALLFLRDNIAEVRLDLKKLNTARQSLFRQARGTDQSLSVHQQYLEGTQDTVDSYRIGAKRYRRIHNILQTIIITGSIVSASVTSAIGEVPWFKVAAPVLSMLVGISAGMTGYFKFRERSMNLQTTADSIEQEHMAVQLMIRRYKGQRADDALVSFAEEVEKLKEEQRKREQQLDQPPEGRQGESP